ncbi:MAG: flagellar biosynthesis protein FlhF [Desulfobulbaceae bacterium]|nr:MAG: flagellar biosynthesis protein FlhF [Desulfobulbaceae bacterium]
MQVKVFEAYDMASGLRKVRKELGPDALILSTRTLKNSRLGILGKSMFEITAAIDDTLSGQSDMQKDEALCGTMQPATYNRGGIKVGQNLENPIGLSLKTATDLPQGEIEELKNLVKTLAGEVSELKKHPTHITTAPARAQSFVSPVQTTEQDDFITNFLIENEVSLKIAQKISGYARESLTYADLNDAAKVFQFLKTTLADLISVAPPDFSFPDSTKRIALVGPTGVGKTTTLAKIAAQYISRYGNSIGFITIDTYRIAAIEQLKVYGEIMRIPVEVVLSPGQFTESIKKFEDKKLLLIDTAGRSHKDNLSIDELGSFFNPELEVEKHLVLSAVTRETELMDILTRFGRIGIDKTIFTKIDECTKLGSIINTQMMNPMPLSYITNGQRVPEDIIEPDKNSVPKLLIPEEA